MVRPRKIAKGQQYGKAKQQEEMIAASEGAAMPAPAAPPGPPGMRPGAMPLSAPTQRPEQDVRTQAPGNIRPPGDEGTVEQRRQALNLLPLLEAAASMPHASAHSRNTVRRLKMFIGDVAELGYENE